MDETKPKEKVLKKVRNALINQSENPFPDVDWESPIYNEVTDSLDLAFAKAFTNVAGKFVYCEDKQEFQVFLKQLIIQENWKNIFCNEPNLQALLADGNIDFIQDSKHFHSMEVGITSCEYLIARLGSILVSSFQACGRKMFCFPPIHIVVAYSNQIVPEIKDAMVALQQKYEEKFPSFTSLITGPSRTADIEKTLVMGAHGPKELYVFLIEKIA